MTDSYVPVDEPLPKPLAKKHKKRHLRVPKDRNKWILPKEGAVKHVPGETLLQSDPIVGTADEYAPHMSAEYVPEGHPVDYPVPNFGVDQDIANTQAHEAAAGTALGHTWTPEFDPVTATYVVPSVDAEFKLMQLNSDPHLQTYDDRYYLDKHFTDEGVNDPEELIRWNFNPALDHDIQVSQANLANQESAKAHTYKGYL